MHRLLLFITIFFMSATTFAAQQDTSAIRRAIDNWLQSKMIDLPGEVSHDIGSIGSTQLAPCSRFDISRPPGAAAWGRGHVTVRCLDTASWRINVPVHIRVKADYYVVARPIAQGQTITADDLAVQIGDLADLPARIVTDASQAVGKTAGTTLQPGAPLRSDLLRAAIAIRQGQSVKVISRGNGFEIANEGRAMNNVPVGQVAQIRMPGGQIVSGVAKANGTVEVSF